MKLIKNYYFVFSFVIVLLFLLVMFCVLKVAPFGDNTIFIIDSYDQYIPFFSVLRDKIADYSIYSIHNFSYSWCVGLGANFLSLFFYYLASPLSIIIAFVPKTGIVGALSILVAIKIALMSSTFSYYLIYRDDKGISYSIVTFLTIAYSFSGYICAYYWNIMWLDSLILLPIVVLGLEKIICGKSPFLYIMSLFITIWVNYYMAFMICIFLSLYYLFYNHGSISSFLKNGIRFILASLLSAGMSAVSLFVVYYGISHTMTVSYGRPSSRFFGNFFYTLRQLFFLSKPVVVDREQYNGYANLYMGSIVILLVFIYMFSDVIKLKERICKMCIIVILLLSMNQSVLNYIWHGFHEQFLLPNRFSFTYVFVLLIMSSDVLNSIYKMKTKRLVISCVLAVFYPIVSFVFVDLDGYIASTQVVLINVIIISIYAIISLLINNKNNRQILIKILMGIASIEVLISCVFAFKAELIIRNVNSFYELDDYLALNEESGLYREEVLVPDIDNETTFLGVKGVNVFCSTIMGDTIYTMMDLGYVGTNNEYDHRDIIPYSDSLLGIRYVYYNDTGKQIRIYDNKSALPLGYAVDEGLQNYTPDNMNNSAANINSIAMLATNENDEIYTNVVGDIEYQSYGGIIHESADLPNYVFMERGDAEINKLGLHYQVAQDGDYYLLLRATYNDDVSIFINDELFAEGDNLVNGMVPITGLKNGDLVDVVISSYMDTPIIWYMDKYNPEAAEKNLSVLAQNPLNITEFKEGDFSGNIIVGDNQMLMLSIPYDKGWKVYDDGKEVDTVPVLRGFTGVKLDAGEHDLRFVYTPEGFKIGLIISIISWILFLTYYGSVRYLKKKTNDKQENNEISDINEIEDISEAKR